MVHQFRSSTEGLPLPGKFTFPFCYTPHPLCVMAADEVCGYLGLQSRWAGELSEGKMFGVLIVRTGDGGIAYLAAFSGNLAHRNRHDFFVPPVFDFLQPDGYFIAGERLVSQLNQRIDDIRSSAVYTSLKALITNEEALAAQEIAHTVKVYGLARTERDKRRRMDPDADALACMVRESQFQEAELKRLKRRMREHLDSLRRQLAVYEDEVNHLKEERRQRSFALQRKLFDSFRVLNAQGGERSLFALFEAFGNKLPPAGAGECAAPKLLQYAYKNRLYPLAMAEFWWKKMPGGGLPQENRDCTLLPQSPYGPWTGDPLRRHGHYYPACQSKCGPVLAFMMQGLEVEENPLFAEAGCGAPLDILYEDEWMLVVNKPAGMLSIPGKNGRESVYDWVKERYPGATGPLVVHRLDMDASGLMVVAKSRWMHKELQGMFASRSITKGYLAILDGTVGADSGEISLPLCLDPEDRPRQVVHSKYGKPSVSRYKVLKRTGGCTRVVFYPLTGRTHQLRVHAAHPDGLNAPIRGDRLYGFPARRLYLHAASLKFVHPVTGKGLFIKARCDFEDFK